MGPVVGKRKLVYSTTRKHDRNAEFVKRRRTDDSSDSSSAHDQEDMEAEEDASNDFGEKASQVRLKQTIDNTEIEITRKRDEVLRKADVLVLSAANSREHFKSGISDGSSQDSKKTDVRDRHMKLYDLPAILYASELIEKATPLMGIVRDMYRGLVDSHYKFQATQACRNSRHGFLSTKEFRNMDLRKFTAGFYGLKRQLRVGEEILRHYKTFLLKRQGNTMKWWGVADFANYVLAPEVLTSLCIQEMHLGGDVYDRCTRERAYDLFANTTEFGLTVADSDPLEPWETVLEEEEKEKEKEQQQKNQEQPKLEQEPSKHCSNLLRKHIKPR